MTDCCAQQNCYLSEGDFSAALDNLYLALVQRPGDARFYERPRRGAFELNMNAARLKKR